MNKPDRRWGVAIVLLALLGFGVAARLLVVEQNWVQAMIAHSG